MSMSKSSKMLQYLNYRMRVTIQDGRQIVGQFLAFDKHMNIVLADAEEYRKIKGKKGKADREEKRALGLLLLRGEEVISLSVDGPPPIDSNRTRQAPVLPAGVGLGKVAGRGVTTVVGERPAGLGGPVRGMGGPAPGMMQPMQGGPPGYMGMPPMGMPGRGMPPMGMPGRGMPPMGMPGRGMPPMGMPGRGMPPMGMPGRGMPPPGMGGPPGMHMPGRGMPQ